MVSTYWSVFVTVRIAHTEITDIGMRMQASTTNTHAEMRRGRCPRRSLAFLTFEVLAGFDDVSGVTSDTESSFPAASGCIRGSVSLICDDSPMHS